MQVYYKFHNKIIHNLIENNISFWKQPCVASFRVQNMHFYIFESKIVFGGVIWNSFIFVYSAYFIYCYTYYINVYIWTCTTYIVNIWHVQYIFMYLHYKYCFFYELFGFCLLF